MLLAEHPAPVPPLEDWVFPAFGPGLNVRLQEGPLFLELLSFCQHFPMAEKGRGVICPGVSVPAGHGGVVDPRRLPS